MVNEMHCIQDIQFQEVDDSTKMESPLWCVIIDGRRRNGIEDRLSGSFTNLGVNTHAHIHSFLVPPTCKELCLTSGMLKDENISALMCKMSLAVLWRMGQSLCL